MSKASISNDAAVAGAGLAGCEAAWQLAEAGIKVKLYEMKPKKMSPAHKYNGFAELVCSNSLKSKEINSASGMLKEEMRLFSSLILECAEKSAVAAGGALAVDRYLFSDMITSKIKSHENIEIIYGEITDIPEGNVIVATGPLTSEKLSEKIGEICGGLLNFYDAASPIVTADSIDMDKAFFASRYKSGEIAGDYLNCPMDRDEYENFYHELINAEQAELHHFDKVYEGCMPVEVMAKRGIDSLRFGPLKPVGLYDPRALKRPWAVLQLRKENADGSLYNMVGFQTNLKFKEQKRVFSLIPGLEKAEFVRYGVMHRNTFIDSPRLLDKYLRLRENKNIFFAGQITGVEGYMESAASGILAGRNLSLLLSGKEPLTLPSESMLGALIKYITDESVKNFQPMGANMGILPSLNEKVKDKKERYMKLAVRGLELVRDIV